MTSDDGLKKLKLSSGHALLCNLIMRLDSGMPRWSSISHILFYRVPAMLGQGRKKSGRLWGRAGNTVKTGIIGPHARAVESPLLVKSDFFLLFVCRWRAERQSFWFVFHPNPKDRIVEVLV